MFEQFFLSSFTIHYKNKSIGMAEPKRAIFVLDILSLTLKLNFFFVILEHQRFGRRGKTEMPVTLKRKTKFKDVL